mgnify:CR=1 FL=1
MAKPSKIPLLNEPETKAMILKHVSEGMTDKELYKVLSVSNMTFKKWKDLPENKDDYLQAKREMYENLLSIAESGLKKKAEGLTLTEEEIEYDGEGNITKRKVKNKQTAPDTLALMFIAKAGNPEVWNPSEFRRLQLEEKQGNDLKDVIKDVTTYNVRNYKEPEGITAPEGFE